METLNRLEKNLTDWKRMETLNGLDKDGNIEWIGQGWKH